MKYHLKNRPDREITEKDEILRLLKNGKYAVLSLCKDNEPYIVTLSCGYDEVANCLYFHCAKDGLKLDFIRFNSQVCATIIEDGGYISEECGHHYKTLVMRGEIQIVTDLQEKKACMQIILNQLENDVKIKEKKINAPLPIYENMVILKLKINEIHGKAGR